MASDQVKDVFEKGIILGPTINKDRYICPDTGAHFEFRDMSNRIHVMHKERTLQYGKDTAGPPKQKLNSQNLQTQQQVQQRMQNQRLEQQAMNNQYSNSNARQGTTGSKEKYQASNNSHYQTEGPEKGGYAVTQEDEIPGAGQKILAHPMPQSQKNNIKQTKEISQALYSTKMGQMIKMKSSNARNGGQDLRQQQNGQNAGTFNHGTAGPNQLANQIYAGGPVGNRQTYTETDEIEDPSAKTNNAMGGSFDSRERVHEIKQRHLASQIPASKINFKKASGTNSKIGTIQGRKNVDQSQFQDGRVSGKGQTRSSIAQSGQPQAAYGDPTYSSNDDSLERKSQAGRRMLTQPEEKSTTFGDNDGRNLSQDSNGPIHHSQKRSNQFNQNDLSNDRSHEVQVIRQAGPMSKTKQPSYANPSKRLSQKSSARQFQPHNQMSTGFSPGRKLQNLPQHIQQQIMRQQASAGGVNEQMIYRQVEDSRNHATMYGQSNSTGVNQNKHYMSIGQQPGQTTQQIMANNGGHSRHLSQNSQGHMGNGPPGGPLSQSQYRGDGQQAAMSKTGMSFQKRMQNQGNQKATPGQAYKQAGTGSKRALGLMGGPGPNGGMGPQGAGHRRQYSTNVGGVAMNQSNYQGGATQLSKSGIYDPKRGRNAKGPLMFHPGGVAASDMNVGGSTGQYPHPNQMHGGASGVHQRNKTQILSGVETANDSVFRSSIMSTDQIQKINYQKAKANQNLGSVGSNKGQFHNGANQRQSAKPIPSRQGGAKNGQQYPNQMVNKMVGGHTVLGHNGQMLQPGPQAQMRVHSGDPRGGMVAQGVKSSGANNKYLQGDGSQGSQGQQNGAYLQAQLGQTTDPTQNQARRPSGKSPGGTNKAQSNMKLNAGHLQTGSHTLKDQRVQKLPSGTSGFEPPLVVGNGPTSSSPPAAMGGGQLQGNHVNINQMNAGKVGANTQKLSQQKKQQLV